MRVTKGSAIFQTMDSIISAKSQFGVWDDNPTLIVEGKDDATLIRLYYHMKGKELPFDVILPSDEEGDRDGKRKVFEVFDKYKEDFNKLICLVDRDYDFILSENRNDAKIYYYHFFELENYIFEDKILKVLFTRYLSCDNQIEYDLLKRELEDSMEIFHLYFHLSYFRELHYRKSVSDYLDIAQLNKLTSLLKIKPESILNNHRYKDLCNKSKIMTYFNEELESVNLSLDKIYESMGYVHDEVATDIDDSEPLAFFKYFISGKQILSSLEHLMKSFKNGTYDKNGDKLSLEISLKKEWIPNQSDKFEQLLNSIERQLIT